MEGPVTSGSHLDNPIFVIASAACGAAALSVLFLSHINDVVPAPDTNLQWRCKREVNGRGVWRVEWWGGKGRNLIAAFAGLELLVSDVHVLSTERAGAVSIVAHGHPSGAIQRQET
jgi:hypothetical protein